jgi:hypothetical protein
MVSVNSLKLRDGMMSRLLVRVRMNEKRKIFKAGAQKRYARYNNPVAQFEPLHFQQSNDSLLVSGICLTVQVG